MWLPIAIISMALYCTMEVTGKKIVNAKGTYAPAMIKIIVIAAEALVSLIIFALKLGEGGMAPWELLLKNPLIMAAALCTITEELLELVAMRYIGLTVVSAMSGLSGVTIFVGMVLVNMLSGKLSAVNELLAPGRLIPIIIIVAGIAILPNIGKKEHQEQKTERKNLIIGILIMLAVIMCDTGDTVVVAYIFSESDIGMVDFLMTIYFFAAFYGIILYLWMCIKSKRVVNIIKKENIIIPVYALLFMSATIVYVIAETYNAVDTAILYIAYPVIPILAAAFLLKEKYTVKQYVCIGAITLATIWFCFNT